MKCAQHYLRVPTRQILDSRGAIPSKTAADAKVAIQEMAEYSQKWHNGTSRSRSTETSDGMAAIQEHKTQYLGRPHYTKDCPQKEEGKTLEEAYYTQFGGPFQGGGYRATAPGYYQRNNANPSFQERRQSMEDTLSKFMSESAKRHEENSNLIKEIRASTDAAIRNQGASIKTLEIQIGQISKVLQERGFGSLPSSTETNPRDQVKSISTSIKADSNSIRRIRSNQYAVSTGQNSAPLYKARQTTVPFSSHLDNHYYEEKGNYGPKFIEAYRIVKYPKGIAKNVLVGIGNFTFPVDSITLDMPEDIKVPLILERPFFSTARAKIDVYKRKITLRVREEKIIFKSVKPTSSIIKRVYMLSLREQMELDLEARLMGETLVINRSLDPFLEDYIELNDLNERFELRRNQGNDLMPTIVEGEVIEEFRTRNEDLDTRIDDYSSYCDKDKKIHTDYAHNLKFLCMIGFEFTHANFFPLFLREGMELDLEARLMGETLVLNRSLDPLFEDYIELNDINEPFELRRNQGDDLMPTVEEGKVIEEFITRDDELDTEIDDYPILENMDAYRDEGMDDVIFGKPFLREVRIKTRRFKGMITIYNGNDEVTYQMVRSHPRFKHHTNEQCNKIPPLLKVSEEDRMNRISHPYQKLKGFYKGVLNLGPDYIRDAKMEKWLTRGHNSVHEMERKVEAKEKSNLMTSL
ncbi:DNA-directed DNA polymerase [Tanacetum coccineum]